MKPYRPDPDKLTNMLFVAIALLIGILCYVTGVFERMSADLKEDKLNIPVVEASANDKSPTIDDCSEVWEFQHVKSSKPKAFDVLILKDPKTQIEYIVVWDNVLTGGVGITPRLEKK